MEILFALITISIFILFLLVFGYVLSSKGYPLSESPLSFQIGVAYFVGIAGWVSILRLASFIIVDAGLSILITLMLSSIFILYYKKISLDFLKLFVRKKSFISISIFVFILAPFLLLYWLPLTLTPDDVNALIGSLHSGRYVALSNYILECDFVPVIGQNIGQSLLVASITHFSFKFPFLYLFSFLLFSTIFLSSFIYGLIYKVSNNVKISVFSSVIFMMGNSSLSVAHVMSIDSGSPFLLNGYTDTLLGVFIVIMILLLITSGRVSINNKWTLFLVGILLNTCFISAPQNIVIFSMALGLISVFFILKHRVLKFRALWLLLALSFCIGIPGGGMLTPSSLHQPVPLVGVQSVKNSQAGVRPDPWIPFYITINSNWPEGTDQTRWLGGQGVFTVHKNSNNHFSEVIYYYEQTFFMGLRNLFFPILGLLILAYISKRRKNFSFEGYEFDNGKYISSVGGLFLIIGFAISYPIILNSYKLELSRFLIPGITLGLLSFVIGLAIFNKSSAKKLTFLLISLGSISVVGPISNSFVRVYTHLIEFERLPFESLLSPGEPIYDYMCLLPSETAKNRKIATKEVISLGLAPLDKITLGRNLNLNIYSAERKGENLSSLGILVSSSGLYNPGHLKLTLEDDSGITYKKLIPSLNTKENQYNFFDLEPRSYVRATLTSLMPGHIVPWSSSGNVCLALNYQGTIFYTPGCPNSIE
jgi:hypothetical protein